MATSFTLCPACKGPTHRVRPGTARALVHPRFVEAIGDEELRYCPSTTCSIVYSSGTASFQRDDLRVRVGEKETEPPIPVCYCFEWTAEDIEREIERTGTTSIPERIKSKIQAGLCQCEIMNPRGICCLEAVNKAVRSAAWKDSRSSGTAPPPPRNRNPILLGGGAVFMSVVASACCWLPLLLVGLGMSAAGVSAFFVQFRPLLFPGTFALLALAWWLARRPRFQGAPGRLGSRRDSDGPPGSDVDACCATGLQTEHSRRFEMNRSVKYMLLASTVLALAILSSRLWTPLVLASGPAATFIPSAAEKQIVLDIEGMTCASCPRNVERALSSVRGVRHVSVSYESRQAIVEAAPFVTGEALARGLERSGYRAAGASGGAEKAVDVTAPVTLLESTLAPLVERFNKDSGKPRVLALLSPT